MVLEVKNSFRDADPSASQSMTIQKTVTALDQSLYFPHSIHDPEPTAQEQQESKQFWDLMRAQQPAHRQQLMDALGPVYSAREAAAYLGVSTMTISNWRRSSKILGISFTRHEYLYPEMQFTRVPHQSIHGVQKGLSEVLRVMNERSDWEKLTFLLTPWPALHGHTPLALLKSDRAEERERLIEWANIWGHHGL